MCPTNLEKRWLTHRWFICVMYIALTLKGDKLAKFRSPQAHTEQSDPSCRSNHRVIYTS